MAAHRVTTLANADKILVLENGVLTEFAAPQDLLRRDGYFARAMQQNRSSV
jgi:ABC-type multidrug transport system fused ATPase/permease subunit